MVRIVIDRRASFGFIVVLIAGTLLSLGIKNNVQPDTALPSASAQGSSIDLQLSEIRREHDQMRLTDDKISDALVLLAQNDATQAQSDAFVQAMLLTILAGLGVMASIGVWQGRKQ